MHLLSWEAHLRTKKSESYHCPLVAFSRVGLPTAQRALACLQFSSVRPGLTRARQVASHEQLHWRVEETGPSSFSSAPQRAGQAAACFLTAWTASRKDKTSAHKYNYKEAAPSALSTLLPLRTEGFRNETINRERKACAHRALLWKLVKQTNPVIPEARTVCNWFKTSPFSSYSIRVDRPTCQINESYHHCKNYPTSHNTKPEKLQGTG